MESAFRTPLSVEAGGDVATLIADASRIEKEWGWRATRDIRACALTHGAFSGSILTAIANSKQD